MGKEHILASMTSSSSAQAEPTKLVATDVRMDILFSRLGAIYGQLWWNNYRTEELLILAKKEWGETLDRFDNQTLKEVLVLYRERRNYPPSLPQFVECCKEAMARRIPSSLRKELSKPCTLEVAKQHIAVMKKILNN